MKLHWTIFLLVISTMAACSSASGERDTEAQSSDPVAETRPVATPGAPDATPSDGQAASATPASTGPAAIDTGPSVTTSAVITEQATGGSVGILLERTAYQVGEEIKVTISNESTEAITLPGAGSSCVVARVWRLEDATWIALECAASGVRSPYFIVPGGSLSGFVGMPGPIIGGPFEAGTFDQSLNVLPAQPPAPGLPATEVPQGILPDDSLPQSEGGAPFSQLPASLQPGIYRVEVVLEVSDQPVSILSDQFTVSE